jgi:O-antigen ligase
MTQMLRIGGAVLCLAGLTFYGFNMNNPNPVRWAFLSAAVCIAALVWAWRGAPVHLCRMTLTGLVFVSYAALSLSWSPDWREGLLSFYNLAILFGVFLTVLHMDRQWLSKAVPVVASGAVAISVAGSILWPESIGLMGNENFHAEFLCLLIPFCLIGRVTWPETMTGAFCLMMGTLAAVMLFAVNPSDSNWAGAGGAAALFLIVLSLRYNVRGAILLLIGGSAFLWAMLNERVLTSINQRLELAYNTILMWWDNPIFGVGLGGFNYYYPDFQEAHVGLIQSRSMHTVWLFAGASHNEYIQALAVLGLVGIAPAVLFIWIALKHRATDPLGNWSLIAVSVLAGLCAVNFPLQNPTTAAIGAIALALALKPGEQIDLATMRGSYGRLRAYLRGRFNGRPIHTG